MVDLRRGPASHGRVEVGTGEVGGDATVVVLEVVDVRVVGVAEVVGEGVVGGAGLLTVVGGAGIVADVVVDGRGCFVDLGAVVVGDTSTTGLATGGGERTSR